MAALSRTRLTERYHPNAYRFIFAALKYTQRTLKRVPDASPDGEDAHITGQELLEGVRLFALEKFGLMSRVVFNQWGIFETADFGRIVFDLVERGEMKKTDQDRLSDFVDVYNFADAFDLEYKIDTSRTFADHP